VNIIELQRALKKLRLGAMASVLETRIQQAQAEPMAPIDLISCLVSDELSRRGDRLLERRRKAAGFRNLNTLDNFDFTFNKKMNRSLIFDLATANFIARHEDVLFLVRPAPEKAISLKPSDWLPFSRAIVCFTAKRIRYWLRSPKPLWMATERRRWNCSRRSRCDHRRSRHA
jgi:hypothetical protein